MKGESNAHPRRWAPEWISVLTLSVVILGLGGGLYTSLNAMEARLRGDMQIIREDIREIRGEVGVLRERVTSLDERVRQLDRRVSQLDDRVSQLDQRVSQLDQRVSQLDQRMSQLDQRMLRLETRFDEEFPRQVSSLPSGDSRISPDRMADRGVPSGG